MKIQMQAEDFKAITQRAAVATAKRSIAPIMESVLIETEGNKIIAKGCSYGYYAEVTTNAVSVIEEGGIVIHRDSLESLYSMKGTITLESAEKAGVVKSAKKTSRFFVQDEVKDFLSPPVGEDKHAFTIKLSKLLETIAKIKPYLSKSEAKPLFQGIHIIGESGLGTFYGCEGTYAIRQRIHGNFETFDFAIPETGKEIKDVSGIRNYKEDCDIKVSYRNGFVTYEGTDFKYTVRMLEGKYPDLADIFNSTFEDSFNVNADEICKLAKEYKKILVCKVASSKTILPMRFTNIGGGLSAMALGNYIQTVDRLETANECTMTEEYIQCFNPEYVELVMKTFGKEEIHIDLRAFLWRINGSDDCSALLVPIRMDKTDSSKIHDFVEKVA